MSLIYLASPYSHEDINIRQERYEKVLQLASELILEQGLIIYSPIVHNHPINLLNNLREEIFAFEIWRKFDSKMIARSDELWIFILDGWRESIGVQEEIKIADSLSMPIKLIDSHRKIEVLLQ